MPINFVPRPGAQPQYPRPGELRDEWQRLVREQGTNPAALRNIGQFGEAAAAPLASLDSGRVNVQGTNFIEQAIKMPAYALEAPLRPLNQITGGGLAEGLEGFWKGWKSIPVLGAPAHALEGVGGVLEASNKAVRAAANYTLAEHLKNVAGKPDSFVSNVFGESLTAGEIRERAMARWSNNPFTGQQFSIDDLTARAMKDTWSFGEFDVHENGLINFGFQALGDPINIALLGGGAALGLTGRALRAATWARPAMNMGTRVAGAPRIGYGALKSLGRAVTETPTGAKFLDEYSSARAILEGQFQAHGTMRGMLRAASWTMRGLYVPGYTSNVARGMNPVRAGVTAYMRGGMQQQIATNAAEQVAGAANGLIQDSALENTVVDGVTSFIHDSLNRLNNDHFLSDNEGFYIAALFSPWGSAVADIPRGIKRSRTARGLPRYADNTLYHLKEEMRKRYGFKGGYDDIFDMIGNGDIAAGKEAFEWAVDQFEAMKAGNQLTDFTRRFAEAEDLAARTVFLTGTVVDKVRYLREVGALQPKSLADYIVENFKRGPAAVDGEYLASEFEITPEVLFRGIGRLHAANQKLAPELARLGNLQIEQGAPITRELLEGVENLLDGLSDTEIVPRDIAAQLMDAGPSLVWEHEWWAGFANTLGQRQLSGKFRRADGPVEGVTVRDLREKLLELKESAPPAAELYHESTAAAGKATKIKPGETMLDEPPFPMPERLKARRTWNTGRVRQLHRAVQTLRGLRDVEFFKNGKPKLASAKELTGPDGTIFKRTGTNEFTADDGRRLRVNDGVLTIHRPATPATGVREDGTLVLDTSGPFAADAELVPQSVGDMMVDDIRLMRDRNNPNYYPGEPESVEIFKRAKSGGAFEIDGSNQWDEVNAVYFDSGGLAAGQATLMMYDGVIQSVNIAVLPAFQRRGIATKIYEHLIDEGYDLQKVSGKSTTPMGKAFTEKFWSKRKGNEAVETLFVDPEALILGVQNGGRIVIAPRSEGPVLAEHGFVEIAKINTKDRDWVHPGPHPQRGDLPTPDPADVEIKQFRDLYGQPYTEERIISGSPSDQRLKEFLQAHRERERLWEIEMGRGVAMGKIAPREAIDAGWYPGSVTPQEMPKGPWYYATGHRKEIMDHGILTKKDTGTTGLGGGPDDTISLTRSKEGAQVIADSKRDTILIARGELGLPDLFKMADAGAPSRMGGAARTGSFREKFRRMLIEYGEGTMTRKPNGAYTPAEVFKAYKIWLKARDRAGGPFDPYWVDGGDEFMAKQAKLDPNNTGVITLREKPGAVGYQGGDPWVDEWRTWAHEAFDIDGRVPVGADMATYAYKGGDVSKIRQNAANGGFAPYRPTKKNVASRSAGVNLARRAANDASLLHPSMDAIGPSPTKAGRHLNPEERRAELNMLIEAAETQRRYLVKQISEADELAAEISGLNTSYGKLGDWFDQANKGEIESTLKLVKDLNEDFPELSVRQGQGIFIDPRNDRFSNLATHRSMYQRMAFDYGYLSPINFLYTSLLSPVNARWLGKQTQTEIHNLLAQVGFTTAESKKFMTEIRDFVMKSRSAPGSVGEKTGTHLFRTARAVPEGFVRDMLENAAPGKSALVVERFGSAQKMMTEAGNRLMRNSARARRGATKTDPLMAAVNGAFRVWQYSPGLETLSGATHWGTKFLYPLLRFGLDPFYHLMNWIEPDMYGITMEGARASRFRKHMVPEDQSASAAEQASLTSIPPGGLRDENVPVDLLLADTGAYTMPRNIRPILERHFDIKRLDSAADTFRAMADEDPIAVIFREQFGDDVKDWSKALDEMMYGYMTKGPDGTVRDAANSVLANLSKEERKMVAPMIERLASMHRGHYNDLVQLYIGRMNRPNIERIFDHFFLFWPLSYQIKAATWLAQIMFNKIGGVPTGAGGAYMYDQYRQKWEGALANDPEFKTWTEDNDGLMFAFEMLFPITPEGMGATLSRPTRYVGSWIADGLQVPEDIKTAALGNYPEINTIPEMITASAAVGPVRTERLFRQIMNGLGVPGFTYDEFVGRPERGSVTLVNP